MNAGAAGVEAASIRLPNIDLSSFLFTDTFLFLPPQDPIGEDIPANDSRAPDHEDAEGEDDDEEDDHAKPPVLRQTRSGRTSRVRYANMGGQDDSDSDDEVVPTSRNKRRGGPSKSVSCVSIAVGGIFQSELVS